MGLDIVAYSNLQESETDEGIRIQMDEFKRNLDLKEGWYDNDGDFHFRAGSYSGYNHWRDTLCRAIHGIEATSLWANAKKFEGKDFFELINFSDCDGQMGPEVSEKLYQDFANPLNRKKLLDYLKENKILDDDFYEANYDDFMNAFDVSRKSGVLCFC
jgi:hypothetical protein